MRKFEKGTETEDILDELLEGMDLLEQQQEEQAEEEEKQAKKQKKQKAKKEKEKKPKKAKEKEEEPKKEDAQEDAFNPNGLPMVLERIEAGLIGSLKILDEINSPIFKPDDIAQLRKPNRLLIKDFVLYKMQEDYYLRRIIKFKGDDIYVAGDGEKEYHIIRKENVIAKAVARERGKTFLSLGFNPKHKFYTFCKVKLAPIRLGNRVKSYEDDQNAESFEAAMQQMEVQAQRVETINPNQTIATDLDLDSDLKSFLDPDDLVRELRGEAQQKAEEEEEEIIYVDENGQEITNPEEYLQQDGVEIADDEEETTDDDSSESTEDLIDEIESDELELPSEE